MAWIVTQDFVDWDGGKVLKGTKADSLIARGTDSNGKRFFNLIIGNTVVAVTKGAPPVQEVE